MLHFNIRSLKKNFTFLNDILMSVKESRNIIAISETKLNIPFNVSIAGYSFLRLWTLKPLPEVWGSMRQKMLILNVEMI